MARKDKSYEALTQDVAKLEEKLKAAKALQAEAKKAEKEKVKISVYNAACEVFENDFIGMKPADIVAYMKARVKPTESKPVSTPATSVATPDDEV